MDAILGLIEKNGKAKFKLVGGDGNTFAILGRMSSAMKKAGWDSKDRRKVEAFLFTGDYNRVLQVASAVGGV
jgi:hypothetical protein